MNLVDSIGELAEDDRECKPLVDFHAHLQQIEELAWAGERISGRYFDETALVGDAWLVRIDEEPVFVTVAQRNTT